MLLSLPIGGRYGRTRFGLFVLGFALVTFVFAGAARSQETADYFKQNCTSCHTIGGGRLVGPDLKDVSKRRDRAWLVQFIVDPAAVIAAGDAYAAQLVTEARGVTMPKVGGITRDRATRIVDLIDAESALPKSVFAGVSISDRPFTATDAVVGAELFRGVRRLSSGAPPCISCHQVDGLASFGGGLLGPDLSDAFARLEGRKALGAWLAAPATPTMAPIYKVHPIAPDEILPLLAFLKETSDRGNPPASRSSVDFLLIGAAGAVASLLAFDFFWRRRFVGVRQSLTEVRS